MKIFLVFMEVEWEGSYLKGVFSTKEKAYEFAEKTAIMFPNNVYEREVDSIDEEKGVFLKTFEAPE